ncbi:hypothetical protein BKA62DRAFT_34973 [Auriculariales sp. MPI-PUGE-AT-0066]|nr:hypothetical protein BKA62DRAFT_34973 [Auriculariales sp. MPI-PUGE-AT-0066]
MLVVAFALATLVALAEAANISCQGRISSGILAIYKNSLTGQRVPLTIKSGALAGSTDGSQNVFNVYPCSSTYFGKNGTRVDSDGTVLVYGQIKSGTKCLARTSDESVKLVTCVTTDGPGSLSQQYWTTRLINHPNDEATGTDRSVSLAQQYYHHLTGGKNVPRSLPPTGSSPSPTSSKDGVVALQTTDSTHARLGKETDFTSASS